LARSATFGVGCGLTEFCLGPAVLALSLRLVLVST